MEAFDLAPGDQVKLRSFAHRAPWERMGIVEWVDDDIVAVRWACHPSDKIDTLPITVRFRSEIEPISEFDFSGSGCLFV